MSVVFGFLSGLVFGLGLILAGMTDPQKVKAFLDLARTVEWFDTLGVPLLGYGTDEFPAFYSRTSGVPLRLRVESPAEIAAIARGCRSVSYGGGIVVANPIPLEQQWDPPEHDRVLTEALALADEAGVTGKAVTPFLLLKIVELSGGRSLEVNLDLVAARARVDSLENDAILARLGGVLPELEVDVVDEAGQVVARVRKTLYVRRKISASAPL